MTAAGEDTVGKQDLAVTKGEARTFTFSRTGGFTGTWTAVAGSTLSYDLTVADSGASKTVTIPAANEALIGKPWRLLRNGVTKCGGTITLLRPSDPAGDGTVTFTDADDVAITVDVVESTASPVLIYDSSATASGNVYATWASVIAAAAELAGPKVIQFRQNETLPTGAWDLNGATLTGIGGNTTNGVRVTFPTGCTITNPGYYFATGGIVLYSTSNAAVLTVSSQRTLVLEDDSFIASKTAAFVAVTATSGTVIVSLRNGSGLAKPSDLSISGGDYESLNVSGAGVAVQIVDACGYSNLQDNVVRGGAGAGTTVGRYVFSSVDLGVAGPGDTQTNCTGWTVTLGIPARRVAFDGDAAVFDSSDTVAEALEALAGASGVSLSDSTPAALGTAAAGVAATASRSDHVHAQSLRRGSVHLPYAGATTYSGHTVAAVTNNYWGSSAQNDYTEWTWVHLDAGTYTIASWGQVGTDRGITTVAVDGNSVGTMDWYAGSAAISRLTIAGVAVTDGTHTIRLTTSSKQASPAVSSGYVTRLIEALTFIRTA